MLEWGAVKVVDDEDAQRPERVCLHANSRRDTSTKAAGGSEGHSREDD